MKKVLAVAIGAILLAGCASYKIPTPLGPAEVTSFYHKGKLPKGKVTVTTTGTNGVVTIKTITIEGYEGEGDSEMVTASADAIGKIIAAGIVAGAAVAK